LDPFDQFDDARLWDALKRLYLVENTKPQEATEEAEPEAVVSCRFTLDTVIEDEGSNLSVGQRSLVSLAPALVKDSKVLILDEATGTIDLHVWLVSRKRWPSRFVASVDYETDKKIQDTIASEFEDHTILCIARKFPVSHPESENETL
jgi:ABC-type multidrug transport system fused ATPase/permease subunit